MTQQTKNTPRQSSGQTQFGNVQISPVNMENRREVDIRPGDTVRVWQKVREADGKIRLQPFEGVVLARRHGTEPGATFTVRRTNDAYGTEKIFPLYSPMIDKIEVTRRAKMRRAKLFHIRKKAAREIKRKMRNMLLVDIATESDTEVAAAKEAEAQAAESADTEQPQEQPVTADKKQEATDEQEHVVEEQKPEESKEEAPAEEPKEEGVSSEDKKEKSE